MSIKLIIFDLDDTILDTTRLLIPISETPQFFARIKQPLPLMDGALDNIKYLSSKYHLVLLTHGDPTVQKQKVASTGISPFFKQIYISNVRAGETKADFFQKIAAEFNLSPSQMFSIGNRRSTDIRLAKQVGAQTCLFMYGEHATEIPENELDIPDFQIHHHKELIGVCKL
jgi:FMN phosphatase YigB (HAD superfamily)